MKPVRKICINVLRVGLCLAAQTTTAQSWTNLGSGMDNAMDNVVNALALDAKGNVYAGGGFTTAGGVSANRIAKWTSLIK